MRVFKFGGASVKSASAVKNVAEVLRTQSDGPLLVVISAMGKITNKLESLVDAYYYNKEEKRVLYKEILNFHAEIIQDLQIAENEYYEVEITDEQVEQFRNDDDVFMDEIYNDRLPFQQMSWVDGSSRLVYYIEGNEEPIMD